MPSAHASVKSPKLQGSNGLTLDRVVAFDWELAMGGETLTMAEIEELARLKVPLVRVRGQWVEMTADDIRAAVEVWKKKATGKASVRNVIQMALGARQEEGKLGIDGVSADGWVGELLERLEGRRPEGML
jgi:hypothetical protein